MHVCAPSDNIIGQFRLHSFSDIVVTVEDYVILTLYLCHGLHPKSHTVTVCTVIIIKVCYSMRGYSMDLYEFYSIKMLDTRLISCVIGVKC